MRVPRDPAVREAKRLQVRDHPVVAYEEREERNEHEPRKDAAGDEIARVPRTDDVSHAQILRRDVAVERRIRIGALGPGLENRLLLPEAEHLVQKLIPDREPE